MPAAVALAEGRDHTYTVDDLMLDLLEDRAEINRMSPAEIAAFEGRELIELDALGEFLINVALKDRRAIVRAAARSSLLSLEGSGIVTLAKQLAGTPAGIRLNALIMGAFNVVRNEDRG